MKNGIESERKKEEKISRGSKTTTKAKALDSAPSLEPLVRLLTGEMRNNFENLNKRIDDLVATTAYMLTTTN